jgi:sialate O-acetylesterase
LEPETFSNLENKSGGMGIYQFHGVGGQIFQISKATHQAFLGYLERHQDEYWVTTFSEAMDLISSQ